MHCLYFRMLLEKEKETSVINTVGWYFTVFPDKQTSLCNDEHFKANAQTKHNTCCYTWNTACAIDIIMSSLNRNVNKTKVKDVDIRVARFETFRFF